MPPESSALPVPDSFCVPPFYTPRSGIQIDDVQTKSEESPFYYDIHYAVQPEVRRNGHGLNLIIC